MRNWRWWIAVAVNLVALGALLREPASKNLTLTRVFCAFGSSSACTVLGFEYWTGYEVPQDFLQAERLFTRSCDRGNGRACRALGFLVGGWPFAEPYREEEKKQKAFMERRKDPVRCEQYLRRACDLGDGQACWEVAGQLTGYSFRKGLRAAPDAEKEAETLLSRACRELHYGFACSDLSALYSKQGDKVKADEVQRLDAAQSDRLPTDLKIWLGAVVASIVLGAVFVRRPRKRSAEPRRPERWMVLCGVLGVLLVVTSLLLPSVESLPMKSVVRWTTMLLGLAVIAGGGLVHASYHRAARIVLAVTGFLLLPLGLFAILLSREIAGATVGEVTATPPAGTAHSSHL